MQCFYEAGKYDKIRLLDILCEALDPGLYNTHMEQRNGPGLESSNHRCHQQYPMYRKGGSIYQVVRKVR